MGFVREGSAGPDTHHCLPGGCRGVCPPNLIREGQARTANTWGITKEINLLPSVQRNCSKGIGGEGKGVVSDGEWQQVPKTLGKNDLLA